MSMFSRTLPFGRTHRIAFTVRKEGMERLLRAAGEIPDGFKVQSIEMYEGDSDSTDHMDVVLVLETADPEKPAHMEVQR